MIYDPLILIVEDDKPISNFLESSLKTQGYRILSVASGKEAIAQAASHVPDLVILDLGLPDIDGMEVLTNLRSWTKTPVIIISARDQERAKVTALDCGADDYLTKPFGVGELLARLRVAFRHTANVSNEIGTNKEKFDIAGLCVDLEKRYVTVDGQRVHLTPIEYRLIAVLVRNAGKVLTHRFLLSEVWGPGSVGQTQNLRVFMANLRRKIEKDPTKPRYLMTEVGVGYRLLDE